MRRDEPQRRLINSRTWRKFRRFMLERFPVCQDCGRVAAREVHHVRGLADHPEDWLDGQWCRCLCTPCHSVRTKRGE